MHIASSTPIRAFALALCLACMPALAQPAEHAGSGDAWVDARLLDISRYGGAYRDAFVDELVRYHGAPRNLVDDLLQRGWSPGDVYYACALASVSGRPCRELAEERMREGDQDWAAVAARLGLAPGAAQFQRLKRRIAASYARWGRPLPADAGLPVPPAPATQRGRLPPPPESPAGGRS